MIIALHNFPKSIYSNDLRHGGRPRRALSPLIARAYVNKKTPTPQGGEGYTGRETLRSQFKRRF